MSPTDSTAELKEKHDGAVAARQFLLFLSGAALIGALLSAGLGLGLGKMLPAAKATALSCPTDAQDPVAPAAVKLTVYNSTSVSGLAASTSQQLKDAGMTVFKVGDKVAPSGIDQQQLTKTGGGKAPQVVIAVSGNALKTAAMLQGFFPESLVLLRSGPISAVDVYLIADKPTFQAEARREARVLKCASTG